MPTNSSTRITFRARPNRPLGVEGAWTFVTLPKAVHAALGGDRARIPIIVHITPVNAAAKGAKSASFLTSAGPYDGEHHFMFNGQMRTAAGVTADDMLKPRVMEWVIERNARPREVKVPADLARALKAAGLTKAFETYAPSHRKAFVGAVEEAKKPETRARRIAGCVEMVKVAKKPM